MNKLFLTNPSALTRETALDMPLLTDKMYTYLANNFFQPLNCTEINEFNLHHFFDAVLSYRACFFSLGFYELVDEMNGLLDVLVNYIDEVPGFSKYDYRQEYYRTADKVNLENDNEIKTLNLSNKALENKRKDLLNFDDIIINRRNETTQNMDTKKQKSNSILQNLDTIPNKNQKSLEKEKEKAKHSNLEFIKPNILKMIPKK